MPDKLLDQLAIFLEKQDMLSKLTEHERLHSYGYSDIHTIAAIGHCNEANATYISHQLGMTRGAVSKITKRLIASNLIEPYTIPENKQKVFYRLTVEGHFLFEEHEKRHALWAERDSRFLARFSPGQLGAVSAFMKDYLQYLDEQIEVLGG